MEYSVWPGWRVTTKRRNGISLEVAGVEPLAVGDGNFIELSDSGIFICPIAEFEKIVLRASELSEMAEPDELAPLFIPKAEG